jgi:hypothetical protein
MLMMFRQQELTPRNAGKVHILLPENTIFLLCRMRPANAEGHLVTLVLRPVPWY